MKKAVVMVAVVLAFAFAGTAMASDGASVYASKCKMCHGDGGKGTPMAPKLAGNDFIKGDAEAIKSTISNGRSGAAKKYSNFPMAMPKFKMSGGDLDALVSYLKSL
ncbi:MAG: c-type cytochrome [Thermodesulfobacteriota bacterium]